MCLCGTCLPSVWPSLGRCVARESFFLEKLIPLARMWQKWDAVIEIDHAGGVRVVWNNMCANWMDLLCVWRSDRGSPRTVYGRSSDMPSASVKDHLINKANVLTALWCAAKFQIWSSFSIVSIQRSLLMRWLKRFGDWRDFCWM